MDKINTNKGFSIVEVVVSLYIITMALLGILSLVAQNAKTRNVNTNQIIASQLSQEALEIMRSKRDTNWLRDTDWRTGGAPGTNVDIIQDGEYGVDYTGTLYGAIDDIDDAELYYDADTGLYTHVSAGNEISRFSRIVRVLDTSASSTQLECEVSWLDGGQTFKYLAETFLYYWQ